MGTRLVSSQPVAAEVVPVNVSAGAPRRRRFPIETAQAWLFLLPAILIIGIFKVLPAFGALYLSLFRWDIVQGPFRGLENYADWLWANPTRAEAFWRSLSTTFTYVLITVPIEIGLAIVLAYILFQKMRARGVYRTLYYLPYITSVVAAAVVFNWLFHPQYGLVNQLIGYIGIGPQQWLDEPDGVFSLIASGVGVTLPEWAAGPSLALVVVAIFTIWHFVGYQVVIFLAGLSNISPEYYEAARLDGASERQLFTKITFPLLSPTTFFVFTVASIGALRSFESIYILTNGGPLDTTRVVTMLVFRTFFQQGQIGLGAALAFILTVIILIFTLIQFRILGRRVQYG
jgi:multiple sugar transport system permease protein